MRAKLTGTFEAGSPEWHVARANGLGGSEIAAVVGLSPYESRYSLWLRKKGIIDGPAVSPAMEWGNRLEAAVMQKFCDEHPEFSVDRKPGTWARGWQIANPDGLAGSVIVECKTARYDHGWGAPGTDQIPPHYACQAQHYMDVLGAGTCHVAVLFSGSDYREYTVHADPADQAYLRAAGEQFMDSLARNDRPTIDDHDATYEAVRSEHPDIDRDAEVEIPADLWHRYCDTRYDADTATAAHRQAKAEVLDHLGDARFGNVNGEHVLRRQGGNGRAVSLYPIKPRSAA